MYAPLADRWRCIITTDTTIKASLVAPGLYYVFSLWGSQLIKSARAFGPWRSAYILVASHVMNHHL